MARLTKDFTSEEIACPCCGLDNIDLKVVEAAQRIRDLMNIFHVTMLGIESLPDYPLIVASGVRCFKHNARVGGKSNSAHLATETEPAKALDLVIGTSQQAYLVVRAAYAADIKRHGFGDRDGVLHYHIDVDESKPQHVLWGY